MNRSRNMCVRSCDLFDSFETNVMMWWFIHLLCRVF